MVGMTNTTTTTNPTTTNLIDTHLAAYGEADAERRAALIAEVWHADGSLIDPPFDGTGREAIAAMTDVVLAHYPGHAFRRTTVVDAHHTFARYGWELVAPDGTVAVGGTDIVELAADGRLGRIIGFFGDLA
jgi:hypothetical protein